MRLSLRTLLAFEDNVFDVEQHRRLEQILPSDSAAEAILQRIRTVVRNPMLGVPGLLDHQEELDPNYVAEYLDHQMPNNVQEQFEAYCLSADKYLAEIASIHHILTNVLGEPARTNRDCRLKCYRVFGDDSAQAENTMSTENGSPAGISSSIDPLPRHFHPQHPPYDSPQEPVHKESSMENQTPNQTPNRRRSFWQRLFSSNVDSRPAHDSQSVSPGESKQAVPPEKMIPAEKKSSLWTFCVLGMLICAVLLGWQQIEQQRIRQKLEEQAESAGSVSDDSPFPNIAYSEPNDPNSIRQSESLGMPASPDNLLPSDLSSHHQGQQSPDPHAAAWPYSSHTGTAGQHTGTIGQYTEAIEQQAESIGQFVEESFASPAPIEQTAFAREQESAAGANPNIPQAAMIADPFGYVSAIPTQAASARAAPMQAMPAQEDSSVPFQTTSLASGGFELVESTPEEPLKESITPIPPPVVAPAATVPAVADRIIPPHAVVPASPPGRLPEGLNVIRESSPPPVDAVIAFREIKSSTKTPLDAIVRQNPPPLPATSWESSPAPIQSATELAAGRGNSLARALPQRPIAQTSAVLPPDAIGLAGSAGQPSLIFVADPQDDPLRPWGDWQLPELPFPLKGGEYLLTAAPFQGTFDLAAGFRIETVGDTKMCMLPADEAGVSGIFVDYGRIIIRSLKPNQPLRIETAKSRGIITPAGIESLIFIDTFASITDMSSRAEPADPKEKPKAAISPILGFVPKKGEQISWKLASQSQPLLVDSQGSILLHSEQYRLGTITNLPNWLGTNQITQEHRMLSDACRRSFIEAGGNGEQALAWMEHHESRSVRAFAYRLWGDLGKFAVPIAFLKERRQEDEDINSVLKQYVKEVIQRDEESVMRFYDALKAARTGAVIR